MKLQIFFLGLIDKEAKKLLGLLFVLLITLILLSINLDSPTEETGNSVSRKQSDHISDGEVENEKRIKLYPESGSRIQDIKKRIHAKELHRIKFCREREYREKIVYEFIIEAPTKEERKEITALCLSAKGLTKNWFTENVTSWQQELLDQYILPSEYRYFSVFVDWPNQGTDGYYSVLGIKDGMLQYNEYGSPTSADGYANVIRTGVPFKTDQAWRFSHILEMGPTQ